MKASAATGGLVGTRSLPTGLLDAAAPCGSGGLGDVDHIIILIQENRSFDHYFGRYKGVRGFDDRSAPGGAAAFRQAFPAAAGPGLQDPMLPFHIDTAVTVPPHPGACTNDIEHQWAGQHDTFHAGANDNWMGSHLATDHDPRQAALTMGHYDRGDLGFYYALADNFTICDNYFCSVIAGTDINRLYTLTATIDPDGFDGGGQFLNTKAGTVQSPGADLGKGRRWMPYPEVLQRAGISWKVYGTPDSQLGDNVLRYFPQYRPVGGDPTLASGAFSSNAFPADFAADCQTGRLPQVAWLLADLPDTEHAPDPLQFGESITHTVLTVMAESGVLARSVLFLTYDENGGFFDHVTPPTPPPGTPGEYLSQQALGKTARAEATTVKGVDLSGDPIGLGFRVPMLVVSPFTRNPHPDGGPLVCSDVFDHTSLLRFIETWSTVKGRPARIPDRDPATRTPGLTPWRRQVVGDLTSAFNFAARPDTSAPTAVLTNVPNRADPRVLAECITTGTSGTLIAPTQPIVQDPTIPRTTALPTQEPLPAPVQRPSGLCAAGAAAPTPAGTVATGNGGGSGAQTLGPASVPPSGVGGPGASLPATGALPAPRVTGAVAVAAVGGLMVTRWRQRRMDERESQPADNA